MSQQFKQRVYRTFNRAKKAEFDAFFPQDVPIYNDQGRLVGYLQPLTQESVTQANAELLSKWREANAFAFPSQFKITAQGTLHWLENAVINNPQRILFYVFSVKDKINPIGHLGLYSFNFRDNSGEIDNVIRGVKRGHKGLMSWALKALIRWFQIYLQPNQIYLRVFADNQRAIKYYQHCGFRKKELIPLRKKVTADSIAWEEDLSLKTAEKFFLKMVYQGSSFI